MLSKKDLVKTPEYWLENIQNELFRQVTAYMKKKGINQTQLAEELGVSKGYVSQVLNGNFNYTLTKLIELSLAIGVVPDIKFKDINKYTDHGHHTANLKITAGSKKQKAMRN